ncbi:hypothetical protein [Myxococcus phage Mx1]|nr:hypothetical protein [Myxococcus phage Mx1]
MIDFKPGDTVICIDGSRYYDGGPKHGREYVVERLTHNPIDGQDYLWLKGVRGGWYPDRFKKVEVLDA